MIRGFLLTGFKGGYNLTSISHSALAVTRVLLGEAPDELPPMIASEAATETVWLVAKEQSKYWKSVDPKSCEPREGKNLMPVHFTPLNPLLAFLSLAEVESMAFSIPGKSILLLQLISRCILMSPCPYRNSQGPSTTLLLHTVRHDAGSSDQRRT